MSQDPFKKINMLPGAIVVVDSLVVVIISARKERVVPLPSARIYSTRGLHF